MTMGTMYASDLASAIGANCVKISKLDTATGKYFSFLPGFTDPRSVLNFQIVQGTGYFVVVKAETFFTLVGEMSSESTVSLTKGWNLVGYNQLAPMNASEFAKHISGARVLKVTYLDTTTGKYYSYLPGISAPELDFQMTSGRAYFVVVAGASTLSFGS
jgi:TctA family transporter